MFAGRGTIGDMPEAIGPRELGIGEDELARAQPFVRGLTIQRYEDLLAIIHDHVKEAQAGERPLDPRYLELEVRILREEAALYRLAKPPGPIPEEEDPTRIKDPAALVEEQLKELEAKIKGEES